MKKWLPLIITLLFAGWYAGKVRVPKDRDWAIGDFGKIPVVVEGRHMPIDTMARTVLTLLRGKQDANYEPWKSWWEKPKMVTATEWALEVMVQPEVGDTRPVIRIDNPELKGLFDLPQEADKAKQTDGKHFSWAQLQPKWSEFNSEVRRAAGKDGDKRTPYEQAVIRLAGGAEAYRKMQFTFGPAAGGDLAKGLTEYRERITAWREAFKASIQQQEFDQEAYRWGEEQRSAAALIAPRKGADQAEDSKWASAFEEALTLERGEPAPTLAGYADMARTFRAGDRAGFAAAVRSHLDGIAAKGGTPAPSYYWVVHIAIQVLLAALLWFGLGHMKWSCVKRLVLLVLFVAGYTAIAAALHSGADVGFTADLKKASREQLLSYAAPFYYGMVIAVFAALLAIASWFGTGLDWLRRTAVQLMLLVLVIHTAGLLARFVIEGRPPVTTLYTSAIFIGWAAAIFGLLLERIYPFAIGVVVAAALDFCSLFIAHHLQIQEGAAFKVLQPVLDTNFWLATHVVMVTLGYAATFFAGFLAIIYIVRGAFGGNLTADLAKALTRMVYAIICFATLFSFVGTILGGLWADQSWGRFWGWDVKENGAVMIVVWNAILLHARWGGLFRERGLMCCAIGGNIVTAWSWFGVNNLNVGLHSYGFTSGVAIALWIFVASQVALILCAWTLCGPSVKGGAEKARLEPQPA